MHRQPNQEHALQIVCYINNSLAQFTVFLTSIKKYQKTKRPALRYHNSKIRTIPQSEICLNDGTNQHSAHWWHFPLILTEDELFSWKIRSLFAQRRARWRSVAHYKVETTSEGRRRARATSLASSSTCRAEGVNRKNVGVFVQARGWLMSFLARSIRAVTELSSPHPLVATPACAPV